MKGKLQQAPCALPPTVCLQRSEKNKLTTVTTFYRTHVLLSLLFSKEGRFLPLWVDSHDTLNLRLTKEKAFYFRQFSRFFSCFFFLFHKYHLRCHLISTDRRAEGLTVSCGKSMAIVITDIPLYHTLVVSISSNYLQSLWLLIVIKRQKAVYQGVVKEADYTIRSNALYRSLILSAPIEQ